MNCTMHCSCVVMHNNTCYAGLPSITHLQAVRRELVRQDKTLGLNTFNDILSWSQDHCLPPTAEGVADLVVDKAYVVPLDYLSYPGGQGIVLTSMVQIQWIKQLVNEVPAYYAFHIDGKHKLHHGKWMLITLGTHSLEWDHSRQVKCSMMIYDIS